MSLQRKPKVPVEFYAPLIALDRAAFIEIIYELLAVSPYFSEAELLDSPQAGARQVFLLADRPMPKALRKVKTPQESEE